MEKEIIVVCDNIFKTKKLLKGVDVGDFRLVYVSHRFLPSFREYEDVCAIINTHDEYSKAFSESLERYNLIQIGKYDNLIKVLDSLTGCDNHKIPLL